jgi:hypothetical protein
VTLALPRPRRTLPSSSQQPATVTVASSLRPHQATAGLHLIYRLSVMTVSTLSHSIGAVDAPTRWLLHSHHWGSSPASHHQEPGAGALDLAVPSLCSAFVPWDCCHAGGLQRVSSWPQPVVMCCSSPSPFSQQG